MNKTDIFGLEYKVNNHRYVLNKTELRSIDPSEAKKNFSIPLNQIDPYYDLGGHFSPLWLLFAGYLLFGVIVMCIQWFNGTSFDAADDTRLIILPVFLVIAGYQLYRHLKTSRVYNFHYLRDGTIAFSLPIDKKNKEKTEEFLQALVHKIHAAPPSNEQTLYLLCQYGLLTNTEATQLDANILRNHPEMKPKENILHFVN